MSRRTRCAGNSTRTRPVGRAKSAGSGSREEQVPPLRSLRFAPVGMTDIWEVELRDCPTAAALRGAAGRCSADRSGESQKLVPFRRPPCWHRAPDTLLQPFQRIVFLPETGVHGCQVKGRNILMGRLADQIVK